MSCILGKVRLAPEVDKTIEEVLKLAKKTYPDIELLGKTGTFAGIEKDKLKLELIHSSSDKFPIVLVLHKVMWDWLH